MLPTDPRSLKQIGPFEITGILGQGGMGIVYKARDPGAGREVAIKLIVSRKGADEQLRRRFDREARALAQLRHRNIMPIHSLGEHEGAPYIVMPLIPGSSLQDRVDRSGRLEAREAATLIRTVGDALVFAHEQGIIHRDLKPSNIMITAEGQPLLTDFGLARSADPAQNSAALTIQGRFLGTPGFMPAEQARGDLENVGPHSDQFALGATLFALLTGRPPQTGSSLIQIVSAADQDPLAPSVLVPDLDPGLEAICLVALQVDPRHRYPTLRAMLDDLDRLLQGVAPHALQRKPRRRSTQEDQTPSTVVSRTAEALGVERHTLHLALLVLIAAQVIALIGVGVWRLTQRSDERPQTAVIPEPLPPPAPPSAAEPVTNAQALAAFRSGQRAEKIGQRDRAIRHYTQALEDDPRFVDAYLARATTYSAKRDLRPALADARQALRQDPSSTEARLLSAELSYALHPDRDQALRAVDAALRDDPRNPRALAFRAYARLRRMPNGELEGSQADAEASEVDAQAALKADPSQLRAHLALAELARASRDFSAAIQHASRALARAPRSEAAYLLRSRVRVEDGDLPGALADAEEVIKLNPKSARAMSIIASLLIGRRNHARARQLLERALELDPTLANAHFYLAYLNMRARPRNYRRAIEQLSKSIELAPSFADAYFQRALCYHDINRFGDALKDLNRAGSLRPKDAPARTSFQPAELNLFRGHCHYRRQELLQAEACYERYVRAAPVGHKAFNKIKKRLEQIRAKMRAQ